MQKILKNLLEKNGIEIYLDSNKDNKLEFYDFNFLRSEKVFIPINDIISIHSGKAQVAVHFKYLGSTSYVLLNY
jgi:hypothetical protein